MRNTVPKMEKRHFEFIAATIRSLNDDTVIKHRIAQQFAGRLSMTSSQFNAERSIEAATKE